MSLSAILIGNESLTRECGAIWLARGHRIAKVISQSPEVAAWAVTQGLAVSADLDALPKVDWLLSIANLRLLPPEVLARVGRGAVNFHDGPLPEHAGVNAPVWALLEGEPSHGITWHLIEGGVDQGRVLLERRFAMAEAETAFSLNSRCFAAGLESFADLVTTLEEGPLPQPQNAAKAQMHRRKDRPAAMGRLDFAQPVADLLRMVRGLDHGRYWNPLTTPKLVLSGRVLNVGQANPVAGLRDLPAPGRVISVSAAGVVIACADGAIRLDRLSCQDKGGPINAATLTATTADLLTPDEADRLTKMQQRLLPQEHALRKALQCLDPLTLPLSTLSLAPPVWDSLPIGQHRPAALALAVLRGLGATTGDIAIAAEGLPGYVAAWRPLRLEAGRVVAQLATLEAALGDPPLGWSLDLMRRDPALAGLAVPQIGLAAQPMAGTVITLGQGVMHVDTSRQSLDWAAALAKRIDFIATEIAGAAAADWQDLPGLTPDEQAAVLDGWNATAAPHDRSLTLATAFEAQVRLSPDVPALAFEAEILSYDALNRRANRAAHLLRDMGVGPGTLVGLCVKRGVDLLVGALAILKAGGAYLPMDPAYPQDRLALFAEDSACRVIVTQSDLTPLLPEAVTQLHLDRDPRLKTALATNPLGGACPEDLAYLIYTSGSTGRPKGVMVAHQNVMNFCAGMNQRLGTEPGTWLAVTSLSFDISVLELFWTLTRGFKVVIASDADRAIVSAAPAGPGGMAFSLYYWGNDDGPGARKYQLLLEGARFADQHGFTAIWTPERHFHAFGGPYPNPSVTGAAVAAVTRNLYVRAGSVVAPLHHPARIAEEWAVIDNLTDGRAGLAFASGWHPDDFVLRPENAPPDNKAAMFKAIEQVRALWRGEAVDFPKADGTTFSVITQPRPVSRELPVWVTTAGNPDTWREAGAVGANVLTHLLGQSLEEVAGKIQLYHAALRAAGYDPATRKVTLMLHSYLDQSREAARQVAEAPMKAYLASAAALVKQYAWAFPAFKKPKGVEHPMQIDLAALSPEENDAILDFAFQRYFEDSGLFGTVEDALARVAEVKAIGVDEVACLIDFGIAPDQVLQGLRPLAEVVARANAAPKPDDFSLAAQIRRHRVTHLQCTPSMARMIALNDDSRRALAALQVMLVGGEALPGALAQDLQAAGVGRLLNMYGPTETTIWSSAEEVSGPEPVQNIGRPLANQQLYVLDAEMQPLPPGVAGELWIGGEGVTLGYWQRPDLTAERFPANPFGPGRLYRSGDLVRWRLDGKLDFLGRADHQVKLRGYRIELGEIEAVLARQKNVTQAVVLAREDQPGNLRLVAYLTGGADPEDLKKALAAELPAHMLPVHYVPLESLPLTPNRKIDRKALPKPMARRMPPVPSPVAVPQAAKGSAADQSQIAARLAAIWSRVLGVTEVGLRDNFFDLGGHSLLAVQAHREIAADLTPAPVSITDIFRFPVLADLAAHLGGAGIARIKPTPVLPYTAPAEGAESSLADAMARRRAMRLARRGMDA